MLGFVFYRGRLPSKLRSHFPSLCLSFFIYVIEGLDGLTLKSTSSFEVLMLKILRVQHVMRRGS